MFTAVHSTPSAGSKGYHASHLPHTRFSVQMFQGKPGFGGTAGYFSSTSGVDPSGYRAMPPLGSGYHQASYQERYSPPVSIPAGQALVPHSSATQVSIPGRHPSPPHLSLNTGPPRVYEPPRLLQPPPPVPHQRGSHLHTSTQPAKYNIYPSTNGQSTFIYEQSLTSKSDLFSEADTDATSIMTYSPTESTATVGGDTPQASPLDAPTSGVPVGIEHSSSRSGAGISSQHQLRMGQWGAAPPAIPQAVTLMKTPSETSIDVRERIAVMNAKHNSASTGSYYSSSPPISTNGSIQPATSAIATVSGIPSQAMFPEVFLPESPPHQPAPSMSGYATNGSIYTADTYTRSSPDRRDGGSHVHHQPTLERRSSAVRSESSAIPMRERKTSVSYATGTSPPGSYPPTARERHDARESSRRTDNSRDRERDWNKENTARYKPSSSPPEIRSRTSSISHGNVRPADFVPGPSTAPVVAPVYIQEDERRPRHPDLSATAAPPMRTRRTSFVSQVSDTTLATAATSGTEPGRLVSSIGASHIPPTHVSQSPPRSSAPRHPDLPRRHSDAEKAIYDRERNEKDRQRDRSPNHTSSSHPSRHPETQRRYSDGDQKLPLRITTSPSKGGGSRSVRWNENLICPSPITPAEKRVGWFNRRGDQLWTNDGVFKAALPGQQYPADLDDYPDAGEGWMNEDGITIDIEHRRVPKLPRRPALKQARTN